MLKIGDQIHLGAKVFMITEYKILTPVVIALVVACGLSHWDGTQQRLLQSEHYHQLLLVLLECTRQLKQCEDCNGSRKLRPRTSSIYFIFWWLNYGPMCASMGLVGLGGLYFTLAALWMIQTR